jgi:nucleoside-diphosphate-sugar epimerase
MSSVLVTGASGFIGRHCVPILAEKGYTVHALTSGTSSGSAVPGVCWHRANLLEPGTAASMVQRLRPDYLLHLAWYAEPGKFWEARENLDWVRASLELTAAFAANKGKRMAAAGSCAEYAANSGECVEKETPAIPATLYGTCKHAFGQMLGAFSRPAGFSSAWGRIFFLYGPHEHPSRLVAYVIRSLLRDEPALCSDGTQTLDFLHVEDAASAFVALLESEAQGPVNIASGRPVLLKDLLREIGTQTGRPELIRFGARPASSQVARLWANAKRLTGETGWKPRYDLADGIRQTIEWTRDAAEMQNRVSGL